MAHRGASYIAPENTLIAFKKAIALGADGIELDVHLSADGIPVVMHDETLDRTTNGKGLIKYYNVCDLESLDAGGWFSDDYAGEAVPTLEQVLKLISDTDMVLNVEMKMGGFFYP